MNRIRLPRATRFRVLMRDEFQCQYCGATAETAVLHVDHLVPVSHGGDHSEENLVTACADCNIGKGASLLSKSPDAVLDAAAAAFDRAQLIRQMVKASPSNPSSIPVDAPDAVVAEIESEAQALAVSIAAGHHKLDYVAACINRSRSYVSRMQTGSAPIPHKMIGPLCAATGSNLLRQFIDMQLALDGGCEVQRLAEQLRGAA